MVVESIGAHSQECESIRRMCVCVWLTDRQTDGGKKKKEGCTHKLSRVRAGAIYCDFQQQRIPSSLFFFFMGWRLLNRYLP